MKHMTGKQTIELYEKEYEARRKEHEAKKYRRDKRIAKMHKNLIAYGFEQITQTHYVIFGFIDFWPTRGKWWDRRKDKRGQYLKHLKKHIDMHYSDLLKGDGDD